MIFCRGCGKEIHETAPNCPHCGFVCISTSLQILQVKDSMWMSVTAFVLAVLCILNWSGINNWDKNIKLGLWIFAIVSLALAITSLQQKMKGKIVAGISIGAAILTLLMLLGKG